METKHLSATARTSVVALLLTVTTAAPAAFAQGPTTGLGLSPSATDCPEYREAAARADELRAEAARLTDFARNHREIAKGYERSVAYDRERLAGTQGALQRAEASLAHWRAEQARPENWKTAAWRDHFDRIVADRTADVERLRAELKACEERMADAGERTAKAVEAHRLADAERERAAELLGEARALLDSVRCADDTKKEKKVKKEKQDKKGKKDSVGRSLIGVGLSVGTRFVIGGRSRRECDGRRP
jgi:hypothetical protein